MKKLNKIRLFIQALQEIIAQNPMEAFLACLFFVLWCSLEFPNHYPIHTMLEYGPAVFLTTCILHHKTTRNTRWMYYLSPLLIIPCYWIEETVYLRYFFTLVVIQLVYVLSFSRKDDRNFIHSSLNYIKGLSIMFFLSSVTWILLLLIFFSIHYIFDIWQEHTEKIYLYTQAFSYGLLSPLFFLLFNSINSEEKEWNIPSSFLANFILSPALLIYAGILYLYTAEIAFTWNLPKGKIAYMVTGFVGLFFLLKGCQPFLKQTYYRWFYDHAGLITLPTLILCWTGVYYRIAEYGFTVARVYLVAILVILTLLSLIYFFPVKSHYYPTAWVAVFLLGSISYIPGINVQDIENYSQANRPQETDDHPIYQYLTLESDKAVDISNFQKAYLIHPYQTEGNYYRIENDSLFVYIQNERIITESFPSILQKQLSRAGITESDSITEEKHAALLEFPTDSTLLLFKQMNIQQTDSGYSITYVEPLWYLTK